MTELNYENNWLIYKCEFGSQVYGTSTLESDVDYKGIFIPSGRDLILQRAPKHVQNNTKKDDTERNTKDDVDEEYFSISRYLDLLADGQTVAIDMLFVPDKNILVRNIYWDIIRDNKDKFLSKQVSSFVGYCAAQAGKYGLKGSNLAAFRLAYDFFKDKPDNDRVEKYLAEMEGELINIAKNNSRYHEKNIPLIKFAELTLNNGVIQKHLQVGAKCKHNMKVTCKLAREIWKHQVDRYGERSKMAEINMGQDNKALSHAVRIAEEAEELLLTGFITQPRPNAEFLLKIKKGLVPYKEVADLICHKLDLVHEAKEKSTLPEAPDYKFIEDLKYDIHQRRITNSIEDSYNQNIMNW